MESLNVNGKETINVICDLNVLDDMFHFLYECTHFNSLRNSPHILYVYVLDVGS